MRVGRLVSNRRHGESATWRIGDVAIRRYGDTAKPRRQTAKPRITPHVRAAQHRASGRGAQRCGGGIVRLPRHGAARRGTIARMLEPPNTARPMLRRAAGMRLLRRPPCDPKY
ncbi:hypothetical protein AQ957_28325 [Burkholderia pseudomallei]|nr:hypothetical protein AQ781_13520 [Burkholderia pseudomallei]OMU79549.1 hypothetical protein AQ782_07520 [Burkholderia pseudomallei]ONE91146.1 hypothetical protein AQ957_28325 [Burkholderia pseudomallei]